MTERCKKTLIFIGDVILLYAALFTTVYIRYGNIPLAHSNFDTRQLFFLHVSVFTPLIFIWLIIFYIHNLYEITSAKNTLEFYNNITRAAVVNFLVAVLFFYFADFTAITPKTNLFIYFTIFSACFIFWRSQLNRILKRHLLARTLILSDSDEGKKLAAKLNQNPQIGYRVEAVIDSVSKINNVPKIIKTRRIREIIADDKFLIRHSFALSINSFLDDIEIINLDKFNERVWRKVNLNNVSQLWFLSNFASARKSVYSYAKRIIDFLVSLLLLPLAFCIGVLISVCIKIGDRGPIFYRQTRVGYKGKYFTLIKFRTMRTDAESKGAQWTMENDGRITKVGKFLRKTRLDELPQLINILRGEMFFVGPRAERPEFHDLLVKEIPFYDRRYLVRPGLTGWAQINYTYGSSVEDTREKLSYDFYYLKNRSLIFDLGIVLKTINTILSGLGR